MKCKIFNIRLSESYGKSDELVLNNFLENIKVSRIFSSVIGGNTPFWSVLIFYEDKTEEKVKYIHSVEEITLTSLEESLYEALRRWRNEQAAKEGITPYMIAHNSWLKQMVKMHVKTKEDLLQIKGFGEKRTEKYGDDILRVVKSFSVTRKSEHIHDDMILEKEKMHCRIFRDLEKNKLIDSDPEHIITLGKYYPKYDKEYKDMDKFSDMILDIKKDEKDLDLRSGEYYYYKEAINYFMNQLHSLLSDTEEYVVCVMPKHTFGTAPSGIKTIAKRLCHPPIIDGTEVIVRIKEIPKKALGGKRKLRPEIESLTIRDSGIIKDKQVLLLDDVTTSGTSLKAGKYILENAGAKLVAIFALGKTQEDSSP